MLVYGIPLTLLEIWLDILILILQDASWIERAQVTLAIFLVQASYLGIVRSKLVWLSQLQKLSI